MTTPAVRSRPDDAEYPSFYAGYVKLASGGDALDVLRDGGREMTSLVGSVTESRGGFRYAEGKWSIREVLGHVIDAERIFTYRALRFARADANPLPGFEENSYVAAAQSDARTIADLARELEAVRTATVLLFESLPDDAWSRKGIASGGEVSVRALAFIAAGHAMHHVKVLRERYL